MPPFPKPRPHRKGSGSRRSKSIVEAARQRDGVCLAGMYFQDGCVPGFDVAHIRSWGAGRSEADRLENVICMCRRHHDRHERREIPDITLQGILYHFYGYGPPEEVCSLLDAIAAIGRQQGLETWWHLEPDMFTVQFRGTFYRLSLAYSWVTAMAVDREAFLREIEASVRPTLLTLTE